LSSPIIPTAEQLGQARLSQWHQNGEALLTFENLRSWMNVAGLVLFTPRFQQLPAPSPSFVEAVLGTPNAEPALADTEQARSLLSRLIAEGIAVPLNLLGTPTVNSGETPDFIVSAPVFSYIFTLRGDKAWKQPPATSGAVKVSPLAAATHEALTRRPALSAYDLTTELGKEVTESAVLRALNELWSHLRVLPIPQPDGAPTLWELTSARFTKQIKAGANAGQPSALSALISLYLGSSLLATEEEIETFLSPLAPRSRIRDVVHALMGARELETLVVDGRTLLHVSGSLPSFITPAADEDAKPVETIEVEAAATLEATDAPRISKFVARPRKIGTGFPSDYGRKFNGTPLDARNAPPERERRPFSRSAKPTFTKPWEEGNRGADRGGERSPRNGAERGAERGQTARTDRPERRDGTRPAFGRKPAFGSRPSFGEKRSFSGKPEGFADKREGFAGKREGSAGRREGFTPRPSFRRDDDSRPPRREFTPRTEGDASGPRKTFSKPGTFGRKREGFSGKPEGSFAPRTPGSYSPRPSRGSGDRADRSFGPRKPFVSRGGQPGEGFSRDRGPQGDSPRPQYRKFDAPRTPRSGSDRPARTGDDDRPARPYSKPAGAGFGAKKTFGKPGGFAGKSGGFAGKPANTFTKFSDGKNPFRKPGKPGGKAGSFKGKPSGPRSPDGFAKPAYRKRKSEEGA